MVSSRHRLISQEYALPRGLTRSVYPNNYHDSVWKVGPNISRFVLACIRNPGYYSTTRALGGLLTMESGDSRSRVIVDE